MPIYSGSSRSRTAQRPEPNTSTSERPCPIHRQTSEQVTIQLKPFLFAFALVVGVLGSQDVHASPAHTNMVTAVKKPDLQPTLDHTSVRADFGHHPQPLTSWCSGTWELRDSGSAAEFTTCHTTTFYIDNGNSHAVQFSLKCGGSASEYNWAPANSCHRYQRTTGSVYCYIETISSGWIGAWSCCTIAGKEMITSLKLMNDSC